MAFPEGWGRKCKLTIDPAKVDANLTDFPVLLTEDNLPSEMLDADGEHPALSGGGDIRFSVYGSGTTQLACEVISFVTDNNPANASAEIWVKIPSVSGSVNTEFYIWWEKAGETQPAANDTYGSQNVWDSNFWSAHRLQESGNGTANEYKDSTANARHGQGGGGTALRVPTQTDGRVGKGQDFDGGDYILLPKYDLSSFSQLTISCWIYAEDITTNRYYNIVRQSNTTPDYILGFQEWGTVLSLGLKTTSGYNELDVSITPGNYVNAWLHIAAIYNGSNKKILVNGSSIGNNSTNSGNINYDSSATNNYGSDKGIYDFFNGKIDEVKFSTTARSNEWINAEYNNQNDPATFIIPGTPLSGAAGPPIGGIFQSPILS